MPAIRNSSLIKRFTDFFKLKTGDMLSSIVTPLIVPTINMPVPIRIRQILDVAVNNSDKTFTVPSGKQWKFLYGNVSFTTSATIGSRSIRLILGDDSGNNLYLIDATNVQTASLTENYAYGQFGDVGEIVAGRHTIPIPINSILSENFRIRILDENVIDLTADDMIVRLIVEEIDVTGEGV